VIDGKQRQLLAAEAAADEQAQEPPVTGRAILLALPEFSGGSLSSLRARPAVIAGVLPSLPIRHRSLDAIDWIVGNSVALAQVRGAIPRGQDRKRAAAQDAFEVGPNLRRLVVAPRRKPRFQTV
jgi:hypothetical protein